MKYAIQFGAGNIGRGFMGQLFWEIGYRTIFIETDNNLVTAINQDGRFPLKLLDAYTKKEIEEFRQKDIRISRSGLIQALIQSRLFSKEEVEDGQKLFELTEKYREFIVNGLNKTYVWEVV